MSVFHGQVAIQFRHPGAQVPKQAHPGDAGYDCVTPTPVTLLPQSVTKVPLGFSLEFPEGFYCQIAPRSGLASKGIWPVGGVIDSNYRGEVVALLFNSTPQEVKFDAGDRVCQLLFLPVVEVEKFNESLSLTPSLRDGFGLGSTGLKPLIEVAPRNVVRLPPINPDNQPEW